MKLDSVKGNRLAIQLKEGILGFAEFDLPNKYLYLDYLNLEQPDVRIEDFEMAPLVLQDSIVLDSNFVGPIDSTEFNVRVDNFFARERLF